MSTKITAADRRFVFSSRSTIKISRLRDEFDAQHHPSLMFRERGVWKLQIEGTTAAFREHVAGRADFYGKPGRSL